MPIGGLLVVHLVQQGAVRRGRAAYPPHEVGDQYEGKEWTWATVRELAMKLTVDANGNDATSADFDPANIVQCGLDAQLTENDPRAW